MSKERGWNAGGRLAPFWRNYPGGRDALAKAVGTTGSALSSRNSGDRPLGYDLGSRLARELGVSVLDLGAPSDVVEEKNDLLALERLAVLEERQAALEAALAAFGVDLRADLTAIARRVHAVEQQGQTRKTQADPRS